MSTKKRIGELLGRLSAEDQQTLVAFAEFLASRPSAPAAPAEIPRPEPIPRPEKESVIAAIKRLSATYHMLDRDKMFHEASSLMAQHVMQGREAVEVIDELEVVFQRHYERHIGDSGGH